MNPSTRRNGLNRRDFLKLSAAATVTAALAQTTALNGVALAQGASSNELSILNYALTLEHLEARAYEIAVGSGLLSGDALDYFKSFGAHEATHVDVLTQTIQSLGGTPVAAQSSYNFPSFANQQEVLEYFHTVEELGAAAYLGQAPKLIGNDDLLTAAVSIHNVEAQHAAALADLIGAQTSPAFGAPKTMDEVLAVVTPILSGNMPSGMPTTGRGGRFFSSGDSNLFR